MFHYDTLFFPTMEIFLEYFSGPFAKGHFFNLARSNYSNGISSIFISKLEIPAGSKFKD